MAFPLSVETASGEDALYTQYNNLRTDVLTRFVELNLLDADSAIAVIDGIASMRLWIPAQLNGFVLTAAHACVMTASSSGTPTFQIYNVTDSVDMLSTRITIDATKKTSYTATTAPVIDAANDDVTTGDELRFDCDVAGTGTTGLTIILEFKES